MMLVRTICLAVFSVVAAAPAPTPGTLSGLILVDQETRGAACLDGSPPGYWMRPGSAGNSDKWVLHAQGGGWCYDEESCAGRAKMALGSSKFWNNVTACYGSCDGILSADPTTNPDFYEWNAVFIGYCDGTSMTGALEGAHEGLMYRGRANLDAVLDSLFARGMNKASDVIFTGGSAGGLATYLNVDYVAERVRALSPSAKVVGLGDAGFFLDHLAYGKSTSIYTSEMTYLFNMSKPTTNTACQKANAPTSPDGWKCFMAQYVVPYIKSPLFIAEGMYDSWQLGNVLQLPCGHPTPEKTCNADELAGFLDYGKTMNATITSVVQGQGRGAFVSACIVHCQTIFNEGEDRWAAWNISGVRPRDAFGNFYFGRTGPTVVIDSAPYPSNPSCPIWT